MSGAQTSIRAYIAGIQGYSKFISSVDILDLLLIGLIFFHLRPNQAILLLLILTAMRGTNILWSLSAADYTDQYSDATVAAIAVGLEIGYFIYEHVNTVSTFHRLMIMYTARKQKATITVIFGSFLILGFTFRIIRCMSRFGNSALGISSYSVDLLCVTNAVIGEFTMLAFLMYKCIQYRNRQKEGSELFDVLVQEGFYRLAIMIPLAILEMLFYGLQSVVTAGGHVSLWLIWICFTGLMARHLSASITGITILLTKNKMNIQSIHRLTEKGSITNV